MCWIDDDAGARSKHGVCAVASVASGKSYYMSSDIHYDDRAYELHVFDPDHIAQAVAGTRHGWDVRPVHVVPLSLPGMPTGTGGGTTQSRNVGGASFDPVAGRLYLMSYALPNGVNAAKARVYCFQVGGG